MKYQPVIDLWADGNGDKVRAGEIRLQSGQWVKCGPGPLSVFDSATAYHIRCFHGHTSREALTRYDEFKAARATAESRRLS